MAMEVTVMQSSRKRADQTNQYEKSVSKVRFKARLLAHHTITQTHSHTYNEKRNK